MSKKQKLFKFERMDRWHLKIDLTREGQKQWNEAKRWWNFQQIINPFVWLGIIYLALMRTFLVGLIPWIFFFSIAMYLGDYSFMLMVTRMIIALCVPYLCYELNGEGHFFIKMKKERKI